MRLLVVTALISTIVSVACAPKQNGAASDVASAQEAEFTGKWNTIKEDPVMIDHMQVYASVNHDPLLVYYAVDTEEPFYQASVDFEVRELKAACAPGRTHVNFVAILNSYFVKHGRKYMKCASGVLTTEHFPTTLNAITDKVSDAGYDPAHPESSGLTLALPFQQKNNDQYKRYPLAHPEMLKAVLLEVAKIFPGDQYKYFLDLKSHGSPDLVMAGLTSELLDKKTGRQATVLNTYLDAVRTAMVNSNGNIDVRNRVACETKGGQWKETACFCPSNRRYINQFFDKCERVYGEAGTGVSGTGELSFDAIGLGRLAFAKDAFKGALGPDGMGPDGMGPDGMGPDGMGPDGMGPDGMGPDGMGPDGMGPDGMGPDGMGPDGMGINFASVGFDGMGAVGMQADAKFGSTHDALVQVLTDLGNAGLYFPFVILEACETGVGESADLKAKYSALKSVDAVYSAKGSLWYRNFDWDRLLMWENAATTDHSAAFKGFLKTWTAKIPNFVPDTSTGTVVNK